MTTESTSPLDWIALAFATFFGAGKLPLMPGTWGTLAAIPLCFAVAKLGDVPYVVITLVLLMLGVVASERVVKHTEVYDPGFIVIDEVVGYMITLALIPMSGSALVMGFFFFRLFDILKPAPVKRMEELPGGLGVMMDDFVAGVLGNLCLRVALLVFPVPVWRVL